MRLLPPALAALLTITIVIVASAQPTSPGVIASAPVKSLRLPTFTPEGHRHLMLRAAEATRPAADRVEVAEMELTLYTGRADEVIEAMLTAPSATFWPERLIAEGRDNVSLERADLTVTGADWTYDHPGQSVIIRRDARVVFHRPLDKIL